MYVHKYPRTYNKCYISAFKSIYNPYIYSYVNMYVYVSMYVFTYTKNCSIFYVSMYNLEGVIFCTQNNGYRFSFAFNKAKFNIFRLW